MEEGSNGLRRTEGDMSCVKRRRETSSSEEEEREQEGGGSSSWEDQESSEGEAGRLRIVEPRKKVRKKRAGERSPRRGEVSVVYNLQVLCPF